MSPAELNWLFWDVDLADLDLARHHDYILERIMTRGDWAAMRWLIRTVPAVELAALLATKAERLPPRERAFWTLIAGGERVLEPGGGRPVWAG
jgi:hypothetical protein